MVERTATWVVGREETARVVEAVLRAGSGRTVGITTAVYPDGSWLTSSDASGAVRVWDKESGQSSLVLDFPDETFFGFALAAVSPDGRFVAVSEMKRVHLWDRETRQAAAVLENDTGRVEALTISPDGAWLATIDREHVVRVWSMSTYHCVAAARTDGNLVAISWNIEITVVGHQGVFGYRFIGRRTLPAPSGGLSL